MPDELYLPHGNDISKDDRIKNISNVILDVHGYTSNWVLTLIEEEQSNEGVI